MNKSYSPEQVQAIAEAFVLARRTFRKRLSKTENEALAKAVIELARIGEINVQSLATRAIVRVLR